MKDRKFKVTMFRNGALVDSAIAHHWTAFLNGHWQREMPHNPGKYIVALGKARIPGEALVYRRGDELGVAVREGAFCKLKELPGEIWWWSVRMPRELPGVIPITSMASPCSSFRPKLKLVVNND